MDVERSEEYEGQPSPKEHILSSFQVRTVHVFLLSENVVEDDAITLHFCAFVSSTTLN